LPILLRLGFWQLTRAEEKRQLLAVYQYQRELPAIPLTELDAKTNNTYRTIRIEGVYERDTYWLLDNRSRNGKVGYEVIMPLLSTKGRILINRGWIEAPLLRTELPQIDTPIGNVEIEGYLYPLSLNALINNSASDLARAWPKRVLQLDQATVEKALAVDVYPLWLRITDTSPGALVTQWSVINTQPEKHVGYAVQWFALAFALVMLYGWLVFRDDQRND
jgi:surfeit locus 1 family protein